MHFCFQEGDLTNLQTAADVAAQHCIVDAWSWFFFSFYDTVLKVWAAIFLVFLFLNWKFYSCGVFVVRILIIEFLFEDALSVPFDFFFIRCELVLFSFSGYIFFPFYVGVAYFFGKFELRKFLVSNCLLFISIREWRAIDQKRVLQFYCCISWLPFLFFALGFNLEIFTTSKFVMYLSCAALFGLDKFPVAVHLLFSCASAFCDAWIHER